MKRDPDLARAILLKAQEAPPNRSPGRITIPDRTDDEVFEHVELLADAGLVVAKINRSSTGQGRVLLALVDRITNAGHDFLEHSRDEGRWARAKQVAIEKTGGVSLEVLKSVLSQLALQALKLASDGPS